MAESSELREQLQKMQIHYDSDTDHDEQNPRRVDPTLDGEKANVTIKLERIQMNEGACNSGYSSGSSSEEEVTKDRTGELSNVGEYEVPGTQPAEGSGATKGNLPRSVYFINDTTGILQAFKTFDELSDYLVEASCNRGRLNSEKIDEEIISTVLSIPLGSMVHHVTMGKYIRYLYEKDRLTDVNVEVGTKTFKAHKVALASYSEYFANLFSSAKGVKNPLNIRIKGISESSFASFLEFVYTGETSITPDIAVDFMVMAEYLKVTGLQKRYGRIIEILPVEHFLKLMTRNKDALFSKAAMRRAKREFTTLINEEGILDIDVDLLCSLLKSSKLIVDSEYQVFQFVVRWISHDLEERVKYSTRILNFVRFTCMSQTELCLCSETTGLIRGYEKFREYLLTANWVCTADRLNRNDQFSFPRHPPRRSYRHLFADETNLPNVNNAAACVSPNQAILTEKMYNTHNEVTQKEGHRLNGVPFPAPLMTSTPRAHAPKSRDQSDDMVELVMPPHADPNVVNILVIGGFQVESNIPQPKERIVERYDIADNEWKYYCKMQEPRRHHAVVTVNGKLYLLGGCNPENHTVSTPSVYVMDLTTKVWSQVADMNDARQQHCACVLDGKVYVMGGLGLDDRVLETVECYDPETDTWTNVSPLAIPVYAAAAAILRGKIYLAGGITKVKYPLAKCDISPFLSSFDPIANRWSFHNDMRFQRCRAEMVNIGDRLFLCGGATITCEWYSSRLISVSSIDEYIEKHDTWCHLTDLVIPRHDIGVAVAGGRIYIVGGITSTGDRVLQSIECYDTRKCSWLPGVQDLPYPTQWLKCVTVNSSAK